MCSEKNKENEFEPAKEQPLRRRFRRNSVVTGIFIIAIGTVLLLRQTGTVFPGWLFTWPVLLIAVGFLGAIKNNFRPGGWLVVMAVGAIFLIDQLTPGHSIQQYAWPVLLIAVGLWIMVRPKSQHRRFGECRGRHREWREQRRALRENRFANETYSDAEYRDPSVVSDGNEFVDTTAVFGGVKKIILSKNFKGGDITNVMGGTEINLMQADIQSKVVIDTTNFFGGTKLIVPPTWDVQSDVVTIFGGVDDKRQITSEPLQPNKIIQLSGVCIFGGIEIKSF